MSQKNYFLPEFFCSEQNKANRSGVLGEGKHLADLGFCGLCCPVVSCLNSDL